MRRFLISQQFLMIYSGILTVVFAVTVLTGFRLLSAAQKFEQVDVQRINLVEPDGTVRLIISNKALAPGIIIKGKEHPHPDRKSAGMIFYNDEGTENGGLIFGGERDKSGKESSYGHLSFDRYEQDQVFTVDAEQDGSTNSAGMRLIDEPAYPIQDLLAVLDRTRDLPADQRKAEIHKFMQARGTAHQRLSLYRTSNGAVELKMKDAEGRDRLVLGVAADGAPALHLLDEHGKVVAQLLPAK
jgi:hypothetical protein